MRALCFLQQVQGKGYYPRPYRMCCIALGGINSVGRLLPPTLTYLRCAGPVSSFGRQGSGGAWKESGLSGLAPRYGNLLLLLTAELVVWWAGVWVWVARLRFRGLGWF